MEQNKVARVIEIIQLLQIAKKGLSIKDLANKLELKYESSRYSLKKDIDELSRVLNINNDIF